VTGVEIIDHVRDETSREHAAAQCLECALRRHAYAYAGEWYHVHPGTDRVTICQASGIRKLRPGAFRSEAKG
jgi:hypothetical protein